jgi:hypothetical protein
MPFRRGHIDLICARTGAPATGKNNKYHDVNQGRDDTCDMPTGYGSPIIAPQAELVRPSPRCANWLADSRPVSRPNSPRNTPARRNPIHAHPWLSADQRGGRRLHGAACLRHPDVVVHHPPGCLLWRSRLQTIVRPDQSRRAQISVRVARHDRHADPNRRRCRAHRRGARRFACDPLR